MNSQIPDSFHHDDSVVGTAANGARGHVDLIAHTERLERQLWTVGEDVWCFVGNGLSNQTFVRGPEGLIAIDSGECVEEMRAAITAVRNVCSDPIVAAIYTHFHYVHGTAAIAEEGNGDVPIWGHAGITGNLKRIGADLSAAADRGLVHQFGITLPQEGADALVNVGLGLSFRDQDHAPFTPGFIEPTDTFDAPTTTTIAGLTVEMTPAPSDADDSINIWFPDLGVCVNNIVWPTLFNVFAIRGEEYRDPRILLSGIDHIRGLEPEHLVGAHGPPMSGADAIAESVTRYRDSIQYMWDQTVRGINKGLSLPELTDAIQMPAMYGGDWRTSQFYGVVEHHIRQIHSGLRGWFDGDEANLFPVPSPLRATRLIDGFGGEDEVRRQADDAIADDDLRWALELATWLIRCDIDTVGRADAGTDEDRQRVASILRSIGQRSTSSNVRNWCLCRALELEGSLDMGRFRIHRFRQHLVADDPVTYTHALRLLIDPDAATTVDTQISFDFGGNVRTGLHVRNHVAAITDGIAADVRISTTPAIWATVLTGKLSLADAIRSGQVETNDAAAAITVFNCFDHASLR